MSTPYPSDFPLAEIRALVKQVRDGTIGDDLATFAKNAWVVQGYAQGALLGEPGGGGTILPFAAEDQQEVALQALEAVSGNGVAPQAAVPWELILRWLLKLLDEWLNQGE